MNDIKYTIEIVDLYQYIFIYYTGVTFKRKLKLISMDKNYIFCGHGNIYLRYLP
jgi:hypothetical protein